MESIFVMFVWFTLAGAGGVIATPAFIDDAFYTAKECNDAIPLVADSRVKENTGAVVQCVEVIMPPRGKQVGSIKVNPPIVVKPKGVIVAPVQPVKKPAVVVKPKLKTPSQK